MAVLAPAAGLADIAVLDLLDALADGLAVSDLRLADVGVDPELAQHAVDQHLEVQLAHAADHGLARFLVAVDLEGRVFLRQASAGRGESLSWSALVLGSTATWMTGSGKSSDSRTMGSVGVAQGVARGGVLEADQGDDVTGVGHLRGSRWLACIWTMRPMRSLRSLRRIEDGVALSGHARVDAGEDRACPGAGQP